MPYFICISEIDKIGKQSIYPAQLDVKFAIKGLNDCFLSACENSAASSLAESSMEFHSVYGLCDTTCYIIVSCTSILSSSGNSCITLSSLMVYERILMMMCQATQAKRLRRKPSELRILRNIRYFIIKES